MHVILLKVEHEPPGRALLETLREAGVYAQEELTAAGSCSVDEGVVATTPLAVICEVAERASVGEIHAALTQAAAAWPEAPVVACRRFEAGEPQPDIPRLDTHALLRLGFHAVADDPAQLPALLRDLEESGETLPPSSSRSDEFDAAATPASMLLPDNLSVARLRAAFEAVASLHFVSDQKSAAQTALVGLAPLVGADRWTIYLAELERGQLEARFEPLAVRGLTESERSLPEGDWRRALHSDSLLLLTGTESQATRDAFTSNETQRKTEGERRVLAVPLLSGDRVLGVLEAVREGASARAFATNEAALLSALALPLSAALANSVRIAEAEKLSQTDDLTKLHNARFLRQYLTAEVKRARRYGSTVTALFFDLDDFKEINDRYGHLVGSHVLMEMATVILTGVRDTDVVARYGGDEFVVILPETGVEMAVRVAERMREKIAEHVFTGGRSLRLRLTASFGLSAFPEHSQSPQQLIADADAAMYEAKAAHKNCVRIASKS
ncbi:MAG TPA: sensor domain-containing diguanylate cyclase [Pyrinomonadaceae bacterium]|jgi:diguanylate cyclase (GGDEF)-like protein|nr:sensor domain-containing diguanylate cyclase [Pyrinomonadaceae bacterium]